MSEWTMMQDMAQHRCGILCYNKVGTRICSNTTGAVSAEVLEQVEFLKRNTTASEVVTSECLSLMDEIKASNTKLLKHRKALTSHTSSIEDSTRKLKEYELAAEGERQLIVETLAKISGLKSQLVIELQDSIGKAATLPLMGEDLGRPV